MKTAELLKQRYPNHIANEYAEARELSLAQFDGHDMIEFAEYYHKQKLEEKCEWKYDEDYDYYNTSCGTEYTLLGGTLEDHYCPFCGKKISLLTQEEK